MNEPKRLSIVANDHVVLTYLTDLIGSILGDAVEISTYSLRNMKTPVLEPLVIMASHSYICTDVRTMFPNSRIIAARKMLNGENLEKLLRLPKGHKILSLITPKLVSYEVIQDLNDLGLTHLHYIPYDPELPHDAPEYVAVDTAVSPGLMHLAPAGIRNIINIGFRPITPQTLCELLAELGFPMKYLDIYIQQYSNNMLHSARKLADHLDQSEIMREERDTILNTVEDGILSTNQNNVITLLNTALINMFGLCGEHWVGAQIREFFQYIGLNQSQQEQTIGSTSSTIFTHKNKTFTCSKTPIQKKGNMAIYSIREVSKIIEMEGEIRRKLNQKGYVAKYNFDDIWGDSEKLRHAKERAQRFAKTNQTILITGESGTGKELMAQAIHLNSPQRNGPFLAVNFAAIPDSLVESELFGYEGGAFTGAKKEGHPGVFEQAHGGTLFLDEIGDASLSIQIRLLRVLQEKEIMRIGGNKVIPISVRIIAATNKSLADRIASEQFRQDLYYRLNVLPVNMPALRERRGDIMLTLERYFSKIHRVEKRFLPGVAELLTSYRWQGNVREVFNVADYIYYSAPEKETVDLGDIPEYILQPDSPADPAHPAAQYLIEEREALRTVLAALIALGGRQIGRLRLLEQARRHDPSMTEHHVKVSLQKLAERGYVQVGSTKQGTSITDMGAEFYRSCV